MNTLKVSSNPTTNNNTLVVNFTTDASDIKDILISKDGGETYISATSFTDTSAFFNVSTWSDGTYSNCILKCIYGEGAVATYTITNTLENVTNDNEITSINRDSEYQATLTTDGNYIMDFIVVLMDGVDVTNEYVTPIYEGGTVTPPEITEPPKGDPILPEGLFMITAINPIDINESYATGEIVSDRGLGITNLTVPKNKPFDILYYTGEPAVKHEISWDFGNTYQDKTSFIITTGTSSYKYVHEAVNVDSYNMVIRVTYADGSIDCKSFTITFN